MSYLLLCALIIVLIIIPAIKILKLGFLSPTFIVAAMIAFSSLSAEMGVLAGWNDISNLDGQVYQIIIFGLIFFMGGEFLAKQIFRKKRILPNRSKKYDFLGAISISDWKYLIVYIIFILTIVLVSHNLIQICNTSGCSAESFSDVVGEYRKSSALFSAEGISFDMITSQLVKICNVTSIIFAYVFARNILSGHKIKNEWKSLLVVILGVVLGILRSGGRASLLKYLVVIIIAFAILANYKLKINSSKFYKKWKKIFIFLVPVALAAFYFILPLTGRSTEQGIFSYMTFYLGSPIPSLNKVVTEESIVAGGEFFGENLFYGIYSTLNKLGITANYKAMAMPSIWFMPGLASNVFTGFFRYYIDFGWMGIIVGMLLCGFIMRSLFELAISKLDVRYTLFYLIFIPNLIDFFRDDFFFTSFISTTTITNLVILIILSWIFFGSGYNKIEKSSLCVRKNH